MKKILSLIVVFIFGIILVGCTGNGPVTGGDKQLSVPQNLRIDGNVAKWSIVDGAMHYVIAIDLDEYQTNTNSFDLSKIQLAAGKHEVKVKAQGDGVTFTSSDYCKAIEYEKKDNSSAVAISKDRYVVKKENFEDKAVLQYSYSEEQYNIYIYYLGKIESIPLAYGAAEEYDGLSDRVIKLSKSSITENSVSESKNYCYTQTNINTNQVSQNTGVDITVGGGAGAFKAEGTISYAIGKVKTEEESKSTSFSDAYSAVESYSKSQGEERTYTINQNYEAGYFYRVALLGDCDLFAFVVYDCVEKVLTVQYDLAPISNSLYYTIEKNNDNVFDSTSSYKEDINFDPNMAIEKGILNYIKESKDLGTKEDPYVISTPNDLANKLRNDNIGVYFMLTSDVDFTGQSYYYTPLNELKGIFIGNGYTIKNYESPLIDNDSCGFFKKIAQSGTVQDVRFENCVFNTVTNTGTQTLAVGVVCGTNSGVISNVIVDGCKLEKVTLGNDESEKSTTIYAGLLCGISEEGSKIEKCGVVNSKLVATALTGYETATCYAGGLVGSANTYIKNCYSRNNSISAITKFNQKLLGAIKGKSQTYSGGLAGQVASGNSVEYCLIYNNSIESTSINVGNTDAKIDTNKDPYIASNKGSKMECYLSDALPETFPSDYWKIDANGNPVINYEWKHE